MEPTGNGSADQGAGIDSLLADFQRIVRAMLEQLPQEAGRPRLVDVLTSHLGVEPNTLAVVASQVPPHRIVDADIALAEVSEQDPDRTLVGIAGDARHHMSFGDLVQGHGGMFGAGLPVGQVDYDRMPTGPGEDDRRQVVTSGIRLFRFEGQPVAVRQQGMNRQFGREAGNIEVMSADRALSDALMARVQALMDERSILRGQVVTFGSDPYGPGLTGVTFVERPSVDADAVVLPAGLLSRVADHVIGMGVQRERLLAHGQHLKRGVLLYGPPGTGKTHTVRHLLSASPGTTAVLLSGGSLRFIHDAAKVARAHQPAIVVLEDCDLVAEDRSFSMGASPLLFEVLDALDGLDRTRTSRSSSRRTASRTSRWRWRSDRVASTWPPRSRSRTATGGSGCSASTGATSSARRPCPPRRHARMARPRPSPRSSCAGRCSRPRSPASRRPTTTWASPSTSCSRMLSGSPAACSASAPTVTAAGRGRRAATPASRTAPDARCPCSASRGTGCRAPAEQHRAAPERYRRHRASRHTCSVESRPPRHRCVRRNGALRRRRQPAKARIGWPGTETRTRKTAPACGSGSSRFSREVVT